MRWRRAGRSTGWDFQDLFDRESVAGRSAATNHVAYYAGAVAVLQQADSVLPGSASIEALGKSLEQSASQELSKQLDRRRAAVRAGVIIPEDGANDLSTTLQTIRQIDPANSAVSDNSVLDSYSEAARAAQRQGDSRRLSRIVS